MNETAMGAVAGKAGRGSPARKDSDSKARKSNLVEEAQIIAARQAVATALIRNLDDLHRPYMVVTANEYVDRDLMNSCDPLLVEHLLEAFARGEAPIGYLMFNPRQRRYLGAVLPHYRHDLKLQAHMSELVGDVNSMVILQDKMERDLNRYFAANPAVFGRPLPLPQGEGERAA
jgi:hypothetical protein